MLDPWRWGGGGFLLFWEASPLISLSCLLCSHSLFALSSLSCMLVPFTCLFLLLAQQLLLVCLLLIPSAALPLSLTLLLVSSLSLLHYMWSSGLLHHSLHCLLSHLLLHLCALISHSHCIIPPFSLSSPSLSLLLHQSHLCSSQTVLLICLACWPPLPFCHLFQCLSHLG